MRQWTITLFTMFQGHQPGQARPKTILPTHNKICRHEKQITTLSLHMKKQLSKQDLKKKQLCEQVLTVFCDIDLRCELNIPLVVRDNGAHAL